MTPQDFYGNPEQAQTPTVRLLESRKQKRKQESNGAHLKISTRISEPLKKKVAADHLRHIAREIEESNAEYVRFEFTVEEVKPE